MAGRLEFGDVVVLLLCSVSWVGQGSCLCTAFVKRFRRAGTVAPVGLRARLPEAGHGLDKRPANRTLFLSFPTVTFEKSAFLIVFQRPSYIRHHIGR